MEEGHRNSGLVQVERELAADKAFAEDCPTYAAVRPRVSAACRRRAGRSSNLFKVWCALRNGSSAGGILAAEPVARISLSYGSRSPDAQRDGVSEPIDAKHLRAT